MMENILEHVLKIIKYFEVKAQVKTEKKRRWFLSKQYLQSFDEPGIADEPLDAEDLHPSYKRKIKRMCRAAKSGMQEGVLTGVFLGGFWGIYKQVAENLSVIILGSDKKETAAVTKIRSDRLRDKGRDNRKKSILYDLDGKAPVRSRATSRTQDRSIRSSSVKTTESGGGKGVRYTDSENTRPNTVGTVSQSRSSYKSRDKVEIVGYAFIQTTASAGADSNSDSVKSEDLDQTKIPKPVDKKESRGSKNTNSSKNKEDSGKNKTSIKENQGSISTSGKKSALFGKLSQNLKSGRSKSKVEDSSEMPEKPSSSSRNKSEVSNQSKPVKSQEPKMPHRTASVMSSKRTRSSQGFRNDSFYSISRVSRGNSKTTAKGRNPQDSQTSRHSKTAYENIIPDPDNSPSVLVDEDQISNGYTSGVMSSVIQISNDRSRSGVMSARLNSTPINEDNLPDFECSISNISEIGAEEPTVFHVGEVGEDDRRSFHASDIRAGENRSFHANDIRADEHRSYDANEIGAEKHRSLDFNEIEAKQYRSFDDNEIEAEEHRSFDANEIGAEKHRSFDANEVEAEHSAFEISELRGAQPSATHVSEPTPSYHKKSFGSQHLSERRKTRTSGISARRGTYIPEPAYHTHSPERILKEEYPENHRTSITEEIEQEPEVNYSMYGSMDRRYSSFVKNITSASTDIARSVTSKSEAPDHKPAARESRGLNLLSAFNDNIIVFSACNCAIVLGVVCTVISTTRASLSL